MAPRVVVMPIVLILLVTCSPPLAHALDVADLRLDAPVDLVRSLIGTLINKDEGGLLPSLLTIATKETPLMRLFNLLPFPKDIPALDLSTLLGTRMFGLLTPPAPKEGPATLIGAAEAISSRLKTFEDFLLDLGEEIKESICTHEDFERGEFVPTQCVGPSLTLDITTGSCTVDAAKKRIECFPPKVVLTKSPTTCNLKYRERCVFEGPQCKLEKTIGLEAEGTIKKWPTVALSVDKLIPLPNLLAAKKQDVLDKVGARLAELVFDVPEKKETNAFLDVSKTIPLSKLDKKDKVAPASPPVDFAAPLVLPAVPDAVPVLSQPASPLSKLDKKDKVAPASPPVDFAAPLVLPVVPDAVPVLSQPVSPLSKLDHKDKVAPASPPVDFAAPLVLPVVPDAVPVLPQPASPLP